MTTYWFDETPWLTYGDFNPVPRNVSVGAVSGHDAIQLIPSQSIRFASNSASVSIKSYYASGAERTYALLQDGVEVGLVVIPGTGSGAYDDFELANSLDTVDVHEYEIVCIYPWYGNSGNWNDAAIVLDDNSLASIIHPVRKVIGLYGDSITGLTSCHETDIESAFITDGRKGDMWQIAHELNCQIFYCITAGSKVNPVGRDSTDAIEPAVSLIRCLYGTNDYIDFPDGAADFGVAYSDMLDNIRTRIGPNKPIVCFVPIERVTGGDYHTLMASLIKEAVAGREHVYFNDTVGWFPVTTDYLPDNLHPNVACYALMAEAQQPFFDVYITGGAELLELNQTANSDPVTELWVTSEVGDTPTAEIFHHSGNYPQYDGSGVQVSSLVYRLPRNRCYAKNGTDEMHVYIFDGTVTLSQAIAGSNL